MEIPQKYKDLYKHWELHTNKPNFKESKHLNSKVIPEIEAFINERMRIWKKKELNEPKPYSTDEVLNIYRFCNIYRELDKQTFLFHTLLKNLRDDKELWILNMFFCRMIANPETINKVGLLSFDEKNNSKVFKKLTELPSPKYGTPYVFPISVIQRSKYPTRELFLSKYLPIGIRKVMPIINSLNNESVVNTLEKILPVFGFNLKFLWTEVLIDIGYQFPENIDLFKRFPIGPGSAPTMKIINNELDAELVCMDLVKQEIKFKYLTYNGKKVYLSAENWEGIGCEFRKYSNLKQGKGRKRLYK